MILCTKLTNYCYLCTVLRNIIYQDTERTICTAEDCVFADASGGLQEAHLLSVDAQLPLGPVQDSEDRGQQDLDGRGVRTLKK